MKLAHGQIRKEETTSNASARKLAQAAVLAAGLMLLPGCVPGKAPSAPPAQKTASEVCADRAVKNAGKASYSTSAYEQSVMYSVQGKAQLSKDELILAITLNYEKSGFLAVSLAEMSVSGVTIRQQLRVLNGDQSCTQLGVPELKVPYGTSAKLSGLDVFVKADKGPIGTASIELKASPYSLEAFVETYKLHVVNAPPAAR